MKINVFVCVYVSGYIPLSHTKLLLHVSLMAIKKKVPKGHNFKDNNDNIIPSIFYVESNEMETVSQQKKGGTSR